MDCLFFDERGIIQSRDVHNLDATPSGAHDKV